MKTYDQCCEEVATKYKLGTKLVTGHLAKYWKEAAEIYAGQWKPEKCNHPVIVEARYGKNFFCDLCKDLVIKDGDQYISFYDVLNFL